MAGRIVCWDEPTFHESGRVENTHIEITEEQLLEQYRFVYEKLAEKYPDKPTLTDEQIIDDIMVINWAWFKK